MTELERARAARHELPMTLAAFELLEASVVAGWADLMTVEAREEAFQRVRAIRDVKQMMIGAAAQADLIEHADALKEQGF